MATSQEFGRRGIPLSSGVFQQTLADVLNPITSQYTNLFKETGAGREQDLLGLAQQIAQLQAGQPGQALSQALQFGGYQQQAQSLAAQIANQQAQQQIAQQQQDLSRRTLEEYQIPSLTKEKKSPLISLGEGSTLYNTETGEIVYKNPKTYKDGDSESDWGWT